jgi:hypothetical protein
LKSYTKILFTHFFRQQIPCVGLGRIDGFSWTIDGSAICAWEGAPNKCQLQVYEVSTGVIWGYYQSSGDGMCGIKTVAWMPSGQFLALACLDDKVSCV